jgi:hypothetical protein
MILAGFATIASVDPDTDRPLIRSSFVAKGWFMRNLKDWDKAKIEEIRPVAYGDWTTGGGGLLGKVVPGAGWIPAKVDHLAMIHCWRVIRGGETTNYLFAEGLNGALLKVKSSRAGHSGKDIAQRCGV